MTIDERLERLVERHEALSLNVELLERRVDTLVAAQVETDGHVRALAQHMATVMDTMNRLGNIIIDHETRLDHLEQK
jgi:hypothetical protein